MGPLNITQLALQRDSCGILAHGHAVIRSRIL
jgi:hypothetical protein